jgi:hypothetical protein
VIAHRRALWPRALDRFDAAGGGAMQERFDHFCRTEAGWLDDFSLFMAVKDAHGQTAWTPWEPDIAQREPSAIVKWSRRCAREIRLHKLTQFLFFAQWQRVHDACRARSIQIMGDLPIFVAHDSADVWAHRELFRLDAEGGRHSSPASLLTISRLPASYGATLTIGGMFSRRPDMAGGSIGFAPCWRWSIASASIISGDSRRRGKCRLTRRRRREANG